MSEFNDFNIRLGLESNNDLVSDQLILVLSNGQQLKDYNNRKVCGDIIIDSSHLNLTLDSDLVLIAKKNIIFNYGTKIILNGSGSLFL